VPFVLLLLVGATHLIQLWAGAGDIDPTALFHRFFPQHGGGEGDPFEAVERILAGISENRGQLSLVAVPTFVWFSTRLFAGIRTSLNDIFDVSIRPPRQRNFVVAFLLAKARDASMVLVTLLLFLVNTLMTAGLALLQARVEATGERLVPQLDFWVSAFGRVLGEAVAFAFSVALFLLIYKYASVRRLAWRTALLAGTFTAVGFEIAKRLYAIYLANFASLRSPAGDANLGAIGLFVLWLYYTAIVFLLGAVVAETWELRRMQRRQRAILR